MNAYDGAVNQQLLEDGRRGRGEQRAACRCAVVCRPDYVVHERRLGSHRKCSTRLEYKGVETSLSGAFSERTMRGWLW